MISCFVGELKEDIRLDVQMFKPTSLSAAIGLAWLQEEKLETKCCQPRTDATRIMNTAGTNPGKTSEHPVKRITPAEMQARCDKGRCYNCDEKFSPGHCCNVQQLYLMEGT